MSIALTLAESGWAPDFLIRQGIRALLRQRIREISSPSKSAARARTAEFVESLRRAPIAIETEKANEQHYEVPAGFFRESLGPRLKYSSCWYATPSTTLERAEVDMLRLTCRRAGLRDRMRILELGCGWGSLTLWMAKRYPNSSIHAVSNSHGQREFIMARAKAQGLSNIRITTCDVNHLELNEQFDRIVSVEMFEHLRNYDRLFEKISSWLAPEGRLFVHIFCHRTAPYAFETEGSDNWLGRYFFTGGIMPSYELFSAFDRDLQVEKSWRVSGMHYSRTAEHWLENMDRRRDAVMEILAKAYGPAEAKRWFQRWRIFFMACAELWGYRGGKEWHVGHYLFRRRDGAV